MKQNRTLVGLLAVGLVLTLAGAAQAAIIVTTGDAWPTDPPVEAADDSATGATWVSSTGLILQRYEGSREATRQADVAFQEPDSWKETPYGCQHDSQD